MMPAPGGPDGAESMITDQWRRGTWGNDPYAHRTTQFSFLIIDVAGDTHVKASAANKSETVLKRAAYVHWNGGVNWSGRQDLNLRPTHPQCGEI
jgi:hypothetical protein